jgi:hypothetical protein
VLFSIEPFTILLALLPLVGYLAIISYVRVSGRGLVTTGARDIAAIAIAISGFFAIGPAELFFPQTAAIVFGPAVWIALILFYALIVTLIALTSIPKVVVFGRASDEIYEPVLRAAKKLDAAAIGDAGRLQIRLPTLNVDLRIDGQRGLDHAKVVSFQPIASSKFWSRLLGELRTEIGRETVAVPRRGFLMLAITLVLFSVVLWQGFAHQAAVVEGFREWLWR